jgi:hypothetical protein
VRPLRLPFTRATGPTLLSGSTCSGASGNSRLARRNVGDIFGHVVDLLMARKSKTKELTEGILGQQLGLAVAAHLARTQLVADPLGVYDGQHLSDMLNVIAAALARTAPLYVMDAATRQPRELLPGELDGARAKSSATILVLKDGRTLAGVSIRRADLRQAIAVLKAVGLAELGPLSASPNLAPTTAKPDHAEIQQTLIALLDEVEEMLRPPLIPSQVQRAKDAAVFIARHTPDGRTANLAMQLMSALHESRGYEDVPGGYRMALARLRAALQHVAVAVGSAKPE